MVADLLPPLLAGGSAVLIFALGIALVAVHTTLFASASRRTALQRRKQTAATMFAGALLAIWFAVGVVIADRSHFQLVSGGLRLPVVLVVGFGPVAALVALLFTSNGQTQRKHCPKRRTCTQLMKQHSFEFRQGEL